MGSLKKKPKPFSAMSMVCCTGVQSRRIMVLVSLTLVLLGCLVLYSAMQNEEWTQDEPCQRKVFLVAFLLLVTSVALCYYALNGELEEDKERLESQVRLTSVKYGDYSTLKPDTLVSYQQYNSSINTNMEEKYLKLLYTNGDKKKSKKQRDAVIEEGQFKQVIKNENSETESFPTVFKIGELRHWSHREVTSNQSDNVKPKSLIVELMPELPLQLCEKELGIDSNNRPINKLGKSLVLPTSKNAKLTSDVPNRFVKDEKNSDAG